MSESSLPFTVTIRAVERATFARHVDALRWAEQVSKDESTMALVKNLGKSIAEYVCGRPISRG